MPLRELKADILIVGGGMGGVAAALGAGTLGRRVILTEETDWIGGQLTSQFVPPDEHPWIEKTGCTQRYQRLREGIRQYYRDHYPLTETAKADPVINHGGGDVGPLCHEPRVSLAVLEAMIAPLRQRGRIHVLLNHKPVSAEVNGDHVRAVALRDLRNGGEITISADYILDATELGDLLAMTRTEYVSGAESQKQTGEPHASESANPENVQGFTWCFPVAFDPAAGANHIKDKPPLYERWRDYTPSLTPPWPGKLFSWQYTRPITLKPKMACLFPQDKKTNERVLWTFRSVVRPEIFRAGEQPHPVTLVNWPMNDYWEHNVIDKPAEDVAVYVDESRELSLAFLYWMQTEAPRGDGGQGYPGLYLRPDIAGTGDGLAMAPYFRESRRIKAMFTVTENHVGASARYKTEETDFKTMKAEPFADSVGIGYYRIDLHPSTAGWNYIDVASLPFQIPLGAIIPIRMENLLPACKNIGTTHITNGCYRLHPVEWNIGEAAGLLAAFCLEKGAKPRAVREDKKLLEEFQALLVAQGVELSWPAF